MLAGIANWLFIYKYTWISPRL